MQSDKLSIHADVLSAMAIPQIIRLIDRCYAVKFPLIKIIPARNIVTSAMRRGTLQRGDEIVDTSSGTFALALAMVGVVEGIRVTVICDPAIDGALAARILQTGAALEMVHQPSVDGGFQGARLHHLLKLLDGNPSLRWTRQYHNPDNPGAFRNLAASLWGSLGRIDCVVGAIGSGGTMSGLSSALRPLHPDIQFIAVDSHGSISFGQRDAARTLRGAGSSVMFDNVVHESFDEVHWIGGEEAFFEARNLYRNTSLYVGATSAASAMIARWWSKRNPGKTAVCIMPDEGYRYQAMFYSDDWLAANKICLNSPPEEPITLQSPRDTSTSWSRFLWNRRTYEAVLAESKPRFAIDPIHLSV